jgi:ATP dependent DNA ligase domain
MVNNMFIEALRKISEWGHSSVCKKLYVKQPTAPTLYYVFDVLWSDGEDTTGKPVIDRRQVLDSDITSSDRGEINSIQRIQSYAADRKDVQGHQNQTRCLVNALIPARKFEYAVVNSSGFPNSTSGGSTPGHAVVPSRE